jgi:hypothetical protein
MLNRGVGRPWIESLPRPASGHWALQYKQNDTQPLASTSYGLITREVTAVSQIFLDVGRNRPRSSGLRPSIELAHGDRTADISARARP